MDLTTLLHSAGTAMIVGTIYGLLFAVLQTRVFFSSSKDKKWLVATTPIRTSLFLGLHYVMRPMFTQINPGIYAAFLFLFFLVAVFLYTSAKKSNLT